MIVDGLEDAALRAGREGGCTDRRAVTDRVGRGLQFARLLQRVQEFVEFDRDVEILFAPLPGLARRPGDPTRMDTPRGLEKVHLTASTSGNRAVDASNQPAEADVDRRAADTARRAAGLLYVDLYRIGETQARVRGRSGPA